jgi:hypothetical protein
MSIRSGWFKESKRHSLAAKGIKTKSMPNSKYKEIFPKTHWKFDSDKDKIINKNDCYPFDPHRQDLYRGGFADIVGHEIAAGKHPNQFGISGGITDDLYVARKFSKSQHYDDNPLQAVVVFDDSIKEVLNPIVYDRNWFQENKDVYKHVTGSFPKLEDLNNYRDSQFGGEKEYFSREHIDLNKYIKHVDVYITPFVVHRWLKQKGYDVMGYGEEDRNNIKVISKRYDIPIINNRLDITKDNSDHFISDILSDNDEYLPKDVPIHVYTADTDLYGEIWHEKLAKEIIL